MTRHRILTYIQSVAYPAAVSDRRQEANLERVEPRIPCHLNEGLRTMLRNQALHKFLRSPSLPSASGSRLGGIQYHLIAFEHEHPWRGGAVRHVVQLLVSVARSIAGRAQIDGHFK